MEKKNGFEVNSKKKGGEIMKKSILLTALVVLFAVPAMAGIQGSKHDLSPSGAGSGTVKVNEAGAEICIFCHAPHNPKQNQPLWNRNEGTATVTFYTSNVTGRTMLQAGSASAFSTNSVSKFCISCHDGSLGMWAGVYNKFAESYTGGGNMTGALAIGAPGSSGLANDHPVNISYTDSLVTANHTELNSVATAQARAIRFFRDSASSTGADDDLVECASCHDPHNMNYGKFLRTTNDGSNLCLACHNK